MDESRKQFEEWYFHKWGYAEDDHRNLFETGPDDNSYYRLGVRMSYDAWQASREAIEIELPEIIRGDNGDSEPWRWMYASEVEDAIRAAGIKVKE